MSSKRADGDAWQTEHPRRRQLPSRRLERERQEALERRAVIESQRQLQWEDDEDDDNRTYNCCGTWSGIGKRSLPLRRSLRVGWRQ
jgi:hypothetical protein